MIRYRLICGGGHEFEAWFASSKAYETEEATGRLACPHCQRSDVTRAIMAPSVRTQQHSGQARAATETPAPTVPPAAEPASAMLPASRSPQDQTADAHRLHQMLREVRALRDQILAKSEDVGPRFAEEARQIHFEEAPDRAIHGEATHEQVRELIDDGIDIMPLPRLPDDFN